MARRLSLGLALACLALGTAAATASADGGATGTTGTTGTSGSSGTTGATGTTGSSGTTGTTGSSGSTGTTGTTGTPAANASISSNWAGYAVSSRPGATRHFTHVVGSWVQPAVTCSAGTSTYSAFWVGIGGLSQSSKALEQTGTEADCDANGNAHYTAWYELVPHGPVTVGLTISPGDSITASVTVSGTLVTLKVRDLTTGRTAVKRAHFAHPDTSSAEWIAEAPSNCNGNNCTALPLSDFGSVSFSGARARLHDGSSGTITSPLWGSLPIELNEFSRGSGQPGIFLGGRQIVEAIPTVLGSSGNSFGVSWAESSAGAGGPGGRYFPGVGA